MNITLSSLDASELHGKIFNIGFSVYALAILAQAIRSYNLV